MAGEKYAHASRLVDSVAVRYYTRGGAGERREGEGEGGGKGIKRRGKEERSGHNRNARHRKRETGRKGISLC